MITREMDTKHLQKHLKPDVFKDCNEDLVLDKTRTFCTPCELIA